MRAQQRPEIGRIAAETCCHAWSAWALKACLPQLQLGDMASSSYSFTESSYDSSSESEKRRRGRAHKSIKEKKHHTSDTKTVDAAAPPATELLRSIFAPSKIRNFLCKTAADEHGNDCSNNKTSCNEAQQDLTWYEHVFKHLPCKRQDVSKSMLQAASPGEAV